MKQKLLFIITLFLSLSYLIAQTPQKFNYQAIARDSSGNLFTNKDVSFRISILQGSADGTSVYQETHQKTTNAYGQVTLTIGAGTVASGDFSAINWGVSSYYIKTEMDANGGSSFVFMGTSQLLSVPYALFAKTADTVTGTISEKDPKFVSSPSYYITNTDIQNWDTAYSWGNHAGLYHPISWLPSWTDISNNPISITTPLSDQILKYNDATGKWENWTPNYLSHYYESDPLWSSMSSQYYTKANFMMNGYAHIHFGNLVNTPVTLSGYGITDAMSTSHVANSISASDIFSWNAAFSWGNHAGLYRPTSWMPSWNDITAKPSNLVTLNGNPSKGDMMYYNGTSWVPLPIGTKGQILKIDSLNMPEWMNASTLNAQFAASSTAMPPDNLQMNSATLTGYVNANGFSTTISFEFGTTTNYGQTIPITQNPVTGNTITNVSANITGLFANTFYHYRIKTENAVGNTYSYDLVFATPPNPPAIVSSNSQPGISSVSFNCVVNPDGLPTTVIFEYGSSTNYGSVITAYSGSKDTINGNNDTYFITSSINSGFTALNVYHYRVKAINVAGITYSADKTFSITSSIPNVVTNFPLAVSNSGTILSGKVKPNHNTTYITFEYGLTSNYSDTVSASPSSVSSSTVSQNVTAIITDTLLNGATYHCRLKARNSLGTAYGNDTTFTIHYIGENYQGGIIYYLDGTAQHGQICAVSDLDSIQWPGVYYNLYPHLLYEEIDSVQTNNNNLINYYGTNTNNNYAALECSILSLNTYNDWLLPTSDALKFIYSRLKSQGLGNFKNDYYWSSSNMKLPSSSAYLPITLNMTDGSQSLNKGINNYMNKPTNANVRPVRIF